MSMSGETPRFVRVLARKDVLALAFGAMIGWGWVVLSGEMTLGDLVMYIFFVGLMVAPLVQMAGIGTQITDAFAGLDRIRELLELPTERDRDAAEGVGFETVANTF